MTTGHRGSKLMRFFVTEWTCLHICRALRAAFGLSVIGCIVNPLQAPLSETVPVFSTKNSTGVRYIALKGEPFSSWSKHVVFAAVGSVQASFMGENARRTSSTNGGVNIRAGIAINLVANTAFALPVLAKNVFGVESCVSEVYGRTIAVWSCYRTEERAPPEGTVSRSDKLMIIEEDEPDEEDKPVKSKKMFSWSDPRWGWQKYPDQSTHPYIFSWSVLIRIHC
jgi:hypothetical protein